MTTPQDLRARAIQLLESAKHIRNDAERLAQVAMAMELEAQADALEREENPTDEA